MTRLLAWALLLTVFAPDRIHGGFPLVSPSAPRILFESNRTGKNQLWIISADGTGEKQLTSRDVDVGRAQWSRDGKSILYSVMDHDTSRIYELWPDSAGERALGAFPGRAVAFSPARDAVIYDVGPWTAAHLMLSGPRGGPARQITPDSVAVWTGVWSPDGSQIAYTVSAKSGMSVWVMNAGGSNAHQVTHLTAAEGRAQVPAWSPDGKHLAFQANAASPVGKSTLWVVDLQTGAEREILPHPGAFLDETPSWFSTGDRIAFQSNRSKTMEVWAVDIDGSDLVQITGLRR
jgi:Tol biopolymer transport system component